MLVNNDLPGVGISSSDYAHRTGRLISLATELRALGAGADFDLPRIAVIGNQSAGKSSVVEAISGISVPRASGTCTRCPMECRLKSQDGPWQCQIKLRREHQAIIATGAHSGQSTEKDFGPLLEDKSLLEEMIRRAQLAILNPGVPSTFFELFDTSSLQPGQLPPGSSLQHQFSSDVVCLDIAGPDVTDLSFIDLPGIISNVAPGQDRGNIDAVRNMVKAHIANDNTLILLTITMRDDIDNQGAADLAHLADPSGSRTIGVLTKPDTVLHGEHENWLRILDGLHHPLKLGYFVTKQPSPEELDEGLTFLAAREREATFFLNNAPWNGRVDLRSRFGTPNLTKELSKLLGTVINKSLPGLREQCKQSMKAVKEELASLPPPPSDQPVAELVRLVTGFNADVGRLMDGSDRFERLLQRCRPAFRAFKRDVRLTCPDMRPFVDEDEQWTFSRHVHFQEDAEVDLDGITNVPTRPPMYLAQVREHIQSSLTRELPFNVPFKAKKYLIRQFSEPWPSYSAQCLSVIHEATAEELRHLVQAHFGKYGMSGLLDRVSAIVENQVEMSKTVTQKRIEWMMELEDPPFTLNDHYFSSYREKYLTQFEATRRRSNASAPAVVEINVRKGDLAELSGPDPYEEELIVMAETAAYFHVSFKRIIDNIPRIIDHDFLRSIMKEIQGRLFEDLELATDSATEKAGAYLAEDEQVAVMRQFLQRKKVRLDEVQHKLWNFGA